MGKQKVVFVTLIYEQLEMQCDFEFMFLRENKIWVASALITYVH